LAFNLYDDRCFVGLNNFTMYTTDGYNAIAFTNAFAEGFLLFIFFCFAGGS
jgi:hypothetical protein